MTAPIALADAPSRATTSVTLSVAGMFNIPLSVYTGVESTRVERKEYYSTGVISGADLFTEVGRSPIRKDTGEVINSADVVRMAQADNGVWVALSDEEIAACTAPSGTAEVISFVKASQVGAFVAEDIKQVRPKAVKGKVNPVEAKAFYLLMSAMSERKVVALVRLAMRGPARYALLAPTGDLTLIHSADQVRNWLPLPHAEVSDTERALALTLIDTVGVEKSPPILIDSTASAVQAYVNAKAAGQQPVAPTPPADTTDLMAALEASIAAAKAAKAGV